MPPKPRAVRKASTASKDAPAVAAAKEARNVAAMPPPPDPAPPLLILEAEVNALSSCLRNAVIKTGQVYGFYADVRKLGIEKYGPRPPRALTASLGREIEKYDQLCDAMESHLLRAITVLQRDLSREEKRIKAEAEAAMAIIPKPPSPAPLLTTPPGSPSQSSTITETQPDLLSSTQKAKPTVPTSVRRQSTISLSSLHRPAFPHKLDLSASALRIHPDEMIPSGLSSPVTLAPKSARTSLPPDLVMAALGDAANRPVDIDLTMSDDIDMSSTGPPGSSGGVESQLGSSADRPIELDLDIDMDIFGDGGGSNSGLNSNAPVPEMFAQHSNSGLNSQQASEPANAVKLKEENDAIDLEILKHLHNHTSNSGDIFAPLGETTSQNPQPHGSAGPPQFHPHESQKQPSPSSILASFGAGSSNSIEPVSTSSGGEAPFDLGNLDLSNFSQLESGFFDEHTASSEMDMIGMDDIFNMEAEATGKEKAS